MTALPPPNVTVRDRGRHVLLAAGFLQVVAVFTPAARVRLAGTTAFVRLPTAGVLLVVLGLLTIAGALRARGWWRAVPAALSGAILIVAYLRIVRNPSGSFVDPLLRHAVHPAWGFVPMALAVALGIIGTAWPRGGSTLTTPE